MLATLLSFFATNAIYPLIVPGFMAGVLAIIVSVFIPTFLAKYKIPMLLGGIAAVLFFTFYGGKYSESSKYALEKAHAELDIEYYRGLSNNVSTEVVIKYIDRIKTVETIKIQYKDVYVDRFISVKDDAACDINTGFVRLHDSAAKGDLPGAPAATDGTTSIFKLSDVASTVSDNYLTCNQVRTQLTFLQEWVNRQRVLANK